jgi:signal transduction histidine kinase
LHRLLERQIKRFLGDPATLPNELVKFIAAVDEAYKSADADRLMIERTLDLMSQELTEANVGLRNQLVDRQRTELALLKEKDEQRVLIGKLEDIHSQLLQSEKMASIGQLAAGIAHEINNPIGYVYSNLGTLEKYVQDTFRMIELYEQAEDAITDPEMRNRIQTAKKNLDLAFLKTDLHSLMDESKEGIVRVKVIVQNLKDFSHTGAADEWHFANLRNGLDSTLLIVNNEIKYKADVVKEYADIPDVECLYSQLNQVFMNLLVNAAHAIQEHGTITVRTGVEGEGVWVDISDTGQGIPPENMQKIFDPFFTTKPVGQGTGLGLSVSYGIVQKHHGRMEVNSQVGKGSTFRVWLPVKQPQ